MDIRKCLWMCFVITVLFWGIIFFFILQCDSRAQEGCGEWIKLQVTETDRGTKFIYESNWPGKVWVRKPCPEDSIESLDSLDKEFANDVWNPDMDISVLAIKYYKKWRECERSRTLGYDVDTMPCPDTVLPYSALRRMESLSDTTHIVLKVWTKQLCNPGRDFKLYIPRMRLDSLVVWEATCEEDYYHAKWDGTSEHIKGWMRCYSFILDRVKYWTYENPLELIERKEDQ